MAKCEHGKERTRCRDCGGGSYCEHGRIKANCSVCGDSEKIFRRYERQAKQRGLTFRLSLREFESLLAAPCTLCGENYAPRGADRKDSRIGYLPWNVQSLCWTCNQLKRNIRNGKAENEQALLAHILKIAKYQELQKQNRAKLLAQPKPELNKAAV
jgi:ribosomal protein L37E